MGRRIAALRATTRALQSCIGEFIGTFMLVFIIVCSVGTGAGAHAPIAIGFGLASLVFAYGYLCKAQYNPAVTLALYITHVQDVKLSLAHVAMQLVGGVLAAVAGGALIPHAANFPVLAPMNGGRVAAFDDSPAIVRAFFAELVFTFNLVHVILNVAASRNAGNQFYGFAIGMALLSGAYCAGGISGASFNPAVTAGLHVGAAVFGVPRDADGPMPIAFIWLYWTAELLGAGAAALVFHFVDEEPAAPDTFEALHEYANGSGDEDDDGHHTAKEVERAESFKLCSRRGSRRPSCAPRRGDSYRVSIADADDVFEDEAISPTNAGAAAVPRVQSLRQIPRIESFQASSTAGSAGVQSRRSSSVRAANGNYSSAEHTPSGGMAGGKLPHRT